MEQIEYNPLFRWFGGFSMDDGAWGHSTFTKNRDRLLGGEIARRFFAQVLTFAAYNLIRLRNLGVVPC